MVTVTVTVAFGLFRLCSVVAERCYTYLCWRYLPRGAAHLDVLVLFASRCYTMLPRGDLDILFEY